MLLLSRTVDERIRIGDDIEIVVVEIDMRRQRVRLGVQAPREIPVHRSELLETTKPAEAT